MTKERKVKLKKLSEFSVNKPKKIAIMNNKGGCGKTTTAIALGLHLVRSGRNVLFWDCDPQRNLTQRLGLQDGIYSERRLNYFFRNSDLEDFDSEMKKLGLMIKYPYLYKLSGSNRALGNIGIMAGSQHAETEAVSAYNRFKTDISLGNQDRDVYQHFNDGVEFYCNYFDYIIIDTAPALEGNLLCKLVTGTVDEIISPVDGVEAALGVDSLIRWVYAEAVRSSIRNGSLPNMTFAMMKYQEDANLIMGDDATIRTKNTVHTALKSIFGDFVCDTGIKETGKLKNKVYGGFKNSTNPYNELCTEIVRKITTRRPNIFSYYDTAKQIKLKEVLLNISENALRDGTDRIPAFKIPDYLSAE